MERIQKTGTAPVRLAIIGSNGYASELIKRIWTIPRTVQLSAIVAPDPRDPILEDCRANAVQIYPDVDSMLSGIGEDCKAILNPTPIHLHEEIAAQCLRAGFTLLQEKPPFPTIQQHDAITEKARESGVSVGVCFNSIYSHLVQRLKAELVSGRFGKVKSIRSIGAWIRTDRYFERSRWAGRLRLDGKWVLDGSLHNPFAHLLANSLYLAAPAHAAMAEPRIVTGEFYRGHMIESEDTASVRVTTREGVPIVCNLTLCPETELAPTTVLDTEEAEIQLINFSRIVIRYSDGRLEHRESYKEDRIEMLEYFSHSLTNGEAFLCDLNISRPFTVAVNAAFDSHGLPAPIPNYDLQRHPFGDSIQTVITGINDWLARAHKSGSLLSEIGVPWASPGTPVDTNGYARFPSVQSCFKQRPVDAVS